AIMLIYLIPSLAGWRHDQRLDPVSSQEVRQSFDVDLRSADWIGRKREGDMYHSQESRPSIMGRSSGKGRSRSTLFVSDARDIDKNCSAKFDHALYRAVSVLPLHRFVVEHKGATIIDWGAALSCCDQERLALVLPGRTLCFEFYQSPRLRRI